MALIGTVPRRCVNLPGTSIFTILSAKLGGKVQEGPDIERFERRMAEWLGAPHVLGAGTGRSAFELGLQALDLPPGSEIVFPVFTFPVMPLVAKRLGFEPVFCPVDPVTYNSGPEHFASVMTEKTSAILAGHLFGRPAPIAELAELCREKGVALMEDCAHALGVRVGGKAVGTFGQLGVYSFAEGKNMPCFGGGAISLMDDESAARAREILAGGHMPPAKELTSKALDVWVKWFVTRPLVFGLTAYQVLKLKLAQGQPLMDSAMGDALLDKYLASDPKVTRFANLQATVGLQQLERIDAFNAGARRNAEVLTEAIGQVPELTLPGMDADNIYVYFPLKLDPARRDDLRHFLLRHGVDTKKTDMADCSELKPFREGRRPEGEPAEAALLELCVYPNLSQGQMRRIGRAIREWATSEAGAVAKASPVAQ
jgi:dTDP-4-amino-4,6-dideoxygalactose transaminase